MEDRYGYTPIAYEEEHSYEEKCTASSSTDSPYCVFNISGARFKTKIDTLANFPYTLLGSNAKEKFFKNGEYCFQRDRQSFESILYYYQSNGVLRRSPTVSEQVFDKEVLFYGIKEVLLNGVYKPRPPRGLKRILSQKPTEYMHYKKLLRIQLIDLAVTITFVLAVMVEQMLTGTADSDKHTVDGRIKGLTLKWAEVSLIIKIVMIIQTACTLWISTFLVMRFYWSENRWKFLKSFLAIMDTFVVISYFTTVILFELETNIAEAFDIKFTTIYRFMACLRMVKLFRMIHVFNLARYNALFFSLGIAVKESFRDLLVIFALILFCIISYATVIFWIEFDFTRPNEEGYRSSKFTSIFASMWWSLVTITTVGYGDMVPETIPGKCVAAMCACSGVPILAIPLPIISQKFDVYYRKYCKRMEKRSSKKADQTLGSKWKNYLERPFFDTDKYMKDIITARQEAMV